MSTTLIFPRWIVSGSGWATSHEGSAAVNVSRPYGSDKATVSVTWKYKSIGGDTAPATGHITIGSETKTVTIVGSGVHPAGSEYTKSQSFEIAVGTESGTLTGSGYISIDDSAATSGKNSSVQNFTETYQSKGASIINTPTFTAGTEGTFAVTRYSSSFTHRLWYRVNSSDSWHSITGSSAVSDLSIAWTPPLSLINNWTTATSGTVQILIRTYSGNTQISTDSSTIYTITVKIPASVVPEITGVTLSNLESHSFGSLFVSGFSKIKAAVTAIAAYSSPIKIYKMAIDSAEYSSGSSTVSMDKAVNTSGQITAVITVTDARGRSASMEKQITVYDYFTPILTIDPEVNGTTIKINYNFAIAAVNDTNTRSLIIKLTRVSDGSISSYTVSLSNYSGSSAFSITKADAETETYNIEATLADKVQSIVIDSTTGVICISRLAGGKGVALFKEAERAGLDVNGDLFLYGHDTAVGSTVVIDSDTSISIAANAQVIIGQIDLKAGVWVVQANTSISATSSGTNRVWATLTTNAGTSWNEKDDYGYQSQTVTSGKDCGFNITRVVVLPSDRTLYFRVKSDSYARSVTKTYISAVRIA